MLYCMENHPLHQSADIIQLIITLYSPQINKKILYNTLENKIKIICL